MAAPSKSHKIIICKREFISKNIYGLLGLQERSRNLYMCVCRKCGKVCVCVCDCVCTLVCVRRRRFITVMSACGKLTSTSPHFFSLLLLYFFFFLSPVRQVQFAANPSKCDFFSFISPCPTLFSPSCCSVPVPFVIDSLLSKLVSIDFHFVFVVAAKILIDSISYHGYFLQQWGNVIRKCFRY